MGAAIANTAMQFTHFPSVQEVTEARAVEASTMARAVLIRGACADRTVRAAEASFTLAVRIDAFTMAETFVQAAKITGGGRFRHILRLGLMCKELVHRRRSDSPDQKNDAQDH